MEITELIRHPEQMNRDTLYELRSTLALYPYFQTARLLMLQNLYLLHDQAFDEELRRAATYVTDRKKLFQMIEAAHYDIFATPTQNQRDIPQEGRTVALIDTFLDSIPDEEDSVAKRNPTPADATVDYVAYLMSSEDEGSQSSSNLKGQQLIDNFLQQEQSRVLLTVLQEETTPQQAAPAAQQPADTPQQEEKDEEYFTETLARIYIKQGRYQKALDIIKRLNRQLPQKNAYFADQIRFLEKLIINNNKQI